MKTSAEAQIERFGEKGYLAISFWREVMRGKDAASKLAAQALINSFYRYGMCKEWIDHPEDALNTLLVEFIKCGKIKIYRRDTTRPIGPDNYGVQYCGPIISLPEKNNPMDET